MMVGDAIEGEIGEKTQRKMGKKKQPTRKKPAVTMERISETHMPRRWEKTDRILAHLRTGHPI
jgi:hypothetical protein